MLLHINNINSLNNFHVEEFNNFSDHAAVYFSIAGNTQINININNTGNVTDKEPILFIARKSQITSPYYHETITNYKILTWTYPAQLKSLHHSYEKMQTNFSQRNTKINIRKPGQENQAKQPGQENQNGLTMSVMQQNKSLNALEIFFQRNNTPGNRIAITRSRTKYNRIRMKTKYKFKVKQG